MIFKSQNIGGFISFLVGIILLSHSVVPHHHHFGITHSSTERTACETPFQGHNSQSPDAHCHAFNIMVSEKSQLKLINKLISNIFNLYLAKDIFKFDNQPIIKNSFVLIKNDNLLIKQLFFTAHTFRGPPTLI